mmetsp:Transcript_55695/g.129873  ORF Transcript_55695/g.129873 Transcript_55695/m.129873 type:complete len:247 (+) Transcript_55695:1173-1913(+)
MATDSALNGQSQVVHRGPFLLHAPAPKESSNERLNLHSSSVFRTDPAACDHSSGMPLYDDRSSPLHQQPSHEECSNDSLDGSAGFVQLLALHMVTAPACLDHRSCNPGRHKPVRVVLAVLVPCSPCPLDSLCGNFAHKVVLLLLDSAELPSLHDLIAVVSGVPRAATLQDSGCSCAALDHAVGAKVIGSCPLGPCDLQPGSASFHDFCDVLGYAIQRLRQGRLLGTNPAHWPRNGRRTKGDSAGRI